MLFSSMLTYVLPRAQGCPDEMAERALREASGEFMRRSQAMTEDRTVTIGIGASVALGTMVSPVLDILDARVDGVSVRVVPRSDPSIEELATGTYVLTWDDNSVSVAPTQTASLTTVLRLVLGVGPDATEIPDALWAKHYEAITRGAVGRLLAMPGTPWTNPDIATFELSLFDQLVTKAAMQLSPTRQHTARRLTVKAA